MNQLRLFMFCSFLDLYFLYLWISQIKPNKFAMYPLKMDKCTKTVANVDCTKSTILATQRMTMIKITSHTNHENPKKAVRRSPFLAKYRLSKKADPKIINIDTNIASNGYKYSNIFSCFSLVRH
jgi:hypothetical protein